MSNKTLAKQPYVWGTIKPGTVAVATLYGYGVGKIGTEEMTFPDGETVRRRFEPQSVDTYDSVNGEYFNDYDNLKLKFQVPGKFAGYGGGFALRPEDINIIKIKPMPKEFRSNATPGSVWRFKEDWTFAGYSFANENTIPAGTEIKIVGKKMTMQTFASYEGEKGIEIADNPIIAQFFRKHRGKLYLPAKEVWAYLELVTAGEQKTYWLVENKAGEKLLTKRYANIGNVKSAIRCRGGLVKSKFDETGKEEDYVPEWLEDGTEWMEQINMDDGMYAVEHDHATDKEIKREDMLEYFTFAKLTQF